MINTQALPAVTDVQAELIKRREWKGREELKGLDEGDLGRILSGLRARLGREGRIADGLRGVLETSGEEYEWGMRVDGGEADEEQEEGGKGESKGDEEEDDLFGEDEDDMVEVVKPSEGKQEAEVKKLAPNPREGWRVADYVRYMDTGEGPKVPS